MSDKSIYLNILLNFAIKINQTELSKNQIRISNEKDILYEFLLIVFFSCFYLISALYVSFIEKWCENWDSEGKKQLKRDHTKTPIKRFFFLSKWANDDAVI